jgi:hypothetical protein
MSSTGAIVGSASLDGEGIAFVPQPSGQSVEESINSQSELASALKAGLDVIDQNQTIAFVKYLRLVLPADGFVFWVRSDLVRTDAIFNAAAFNTWGENQAKAIMAAPELFVAHGSMHFTTTNAQNIDESFSVNRVVFTSKQRINDLNDIMPATMYIATHREFRFAFSQRTSFYRQADLYHYQGDAVYPVMESQIIDDLTQITTGLQIISNSLPIWLQLNKICPMFPSMLVPDNIRPPYCAVDIQETDTMSMQPIPWIDKDGSHYQLVKDRVKLIFYGLNNGAALDFMDYMLHESVLHDRFGILSPGVTMRDVKRGQVELSAIAQKKSMEVNISYLQTVARNVARQLILQAVDGGDCFLNEGIT